MKALVIGYGSIGARHARLLDESGVEVSAVTRNASCPYPRHASIADALAAFAPDAVVVANETARHAEALGALKAAGFCGRVLVEKPLFGGETGADDVASLDMTVAFNLRFHPLVARLREAVAGRRLFAATFHAGQHLPQWRPAADYRDSYSAKPELGGGVLRDLSHELDLATWICGPATRVAAIVGTFGDLDIRSEDTVALILETEQCPAVSVTLNYLDRTPRRLISINAEGVTATADLVAGAIDVNGERSTVAPERDETYRRQLLAFLAGDRDIAASFEQGLHVDRLIGAAAAAASSGSWRHLAGGA